MTEQTFADAVIARSATVPVLVDFWAPWCQPCLRLSPVIEQAVDATGGAVELVKIDIDQNPTLARRFGVQGIPNVKAFRDGKVVDEFTGAQPPAAVERFIAGLVPSQAEALIAAGDEASLRAALELEPASPAARVALARIELTRGDETAARDVLALVEHEREASGLLARLDLQADPAAPAQARLGLEALARGEFEVALRALLEAVGESSGETRDLLRRVMVGLFAELGDTHELAVTFRKRLAVALY